jgi:hypothetical protein
VQNVRAGLSKSQHLLVSLPGGYIQLQSTPNLINPLDTLQPELIFSCRVRAYSYEFAGKLLMEDVLLCDSDI